MRISNRDKLNICIEDKTKILLHMVHALSRVFIFPYSLEQPYVRVP